MTPGVEFEREKPNDPGEYNILVRIVVDRRSFGPQYPS